MPTRLTLNGGVYHFKHVSLANDARIECAAPCELRVAERVKVDSRSYIGPTPGVFGLGSGNVELLVHGTNASPSPHSSPAAMEVANDSVLRAYVLVPNGTLRLGDRVHLCDDAVHRDGVLDGGRTGTFVRGSGAR